MNKEFNEKVRKTVWLSEEENEKLKCCATSCGLTQAEFILQLCKEKTPKPKPIKAFWELLNTLYDVHEGFQKCAKYEPSLLSVCKEIEAFILELQKVG